MVVCVVVVVVVVVVAGGEAGVPVAQSSTRFLKIYYKPPNPEAILTVFQQLNCYPILYYTVLYSLYYTISYHIINYYTIPTILYPALSFHTLP